MQWYYHFWLALLTVTMMISSTRVCTVDSTDSKVVATSIIFQHIKGCLAMRQFSFSRVMQIIIVIMMMQDDRLQIGHVVRYQWIRLSVELWNSADLYLKLTPTRLIQVRLLLMTATIADCTKSCHYVSVLENLSVSVKSLAVKTASEMTYIVSCGALNSTHLKILTCHSLDCLGIYPVQC